MSDLTSELSTRVDFLADIINIIGEVKPITGLACLFLGCALSRLGGVSEENVKKTVNILYPLTEKWLVECKGVELKPLKPEPNVAPTEI